jgi:hypothetical protein
MAGDLVISTINGQAIGTKNIIIDGNFNVNQRGVSGTVTLAAGAYGHDRWKGGASGCTYTFATVDNVTTLTISAGSLIQVVEGLNLQSGTYTLSFSGTAQGKIGAGSFSSSGVTGTATGGTNLNIEFNTGTLSLVQLEKGSTATSFDYRPYGTELALCMRYCVNYNSANANSPYFRYGLGENEGTTTASQMIQFLVPMRTIPTLTTTGTAANYGVYSAGALVSCTAVPVIGTSSSLTAQISWTTAAVLTAGGASSVLSNNNNTSYLIFSAEL